MGKLWGIDMISATEGWAVGEGGILHYSGGTWTPQPSGTTEWLYDVSMISASEGWAVGTAGTILHYANGTWTPQVSGTTSNFYGVRMTSASEGWVVGSGDAWRDGQVAHYTGGAWVLEPPQPADPGSYYFDVDTLGSGAILIVDGLGNHRRYSGGTWSAVPGAGLRGLDMISSNEGWGVGSGGTILHYANGAWTPQASGTTNNLEGVSMVSPTEGWAVGGLNSPASLLHYYEPQRSVTLSPSGITLQFENVSSLGNSSATPSSGHLPDGNFRIISGGYFDITTTAVFTGGVLVTVPYDPAQVGSYEGGLKLFHWKNNGWEDITVSVDVVNHTITGRTTSFSDFAVMESSSQPTMTPASSGLGIALAGLVGVAGLVVHRRRRQARA
jgi:MYXO-CTERM domain-containing protein